MKVLRLCAFALGLLLAIALLLLPLAKWRWHVLALVARGLLRLLGGVVIVEGSVNTQARILVANHVSWVDALAMLSLRPLAFVTSTDVQKDPILGVFTALAGCLYVNRTAKKVYQEIEAFERFKDSIPCLAFFPEGTSTNNELLAFKSPLFAMCERWQTGVQVMHLSYGLQKVQGTRESAKHLYYFGEMKFFPHLWQVLCGPRFRVFVKIGPVFTAQSNRKELSRACEDWIRRVGKVCT